MNSYFLCIKMNKYEFSRMNLNKNNKITANRLHKNLNSDIICA